MNAEELQKSESGSLTDKQINPQTSQTTYVNIGVESHHHEENYISLKSALLDLQVVAALPTSLQDKAMQMAEKQQDADIKRDANEQEQINLRKLKALEYNYQIELRKLEAEIKSDAKGKTIGAILGTLLLLVVFGGAAAQMYFSYTHSGALIMGGSALGVAIALIVKHCTRNINSKEIKQQKESK
ncbi:MAG: hypothetical protein SNG49_09545 [Rikenellaceae bacterium]